MISKPLLSIIIPFYNAATKSDRLVARLSEELPSEIEIVCVDDGSTDDTPRVLQHLEHRIGASCRVIRQANRGPGGARNTGLFEARGEFVWFVDSDDDLSFDGMSTLRSLLDPSVDFVDFNILENGLSVNTMGLADGSYAVSPSAGAQAVTTAHMIVRFGRIWSKAFRRTFLLSQRIYFPELCIFEDNAFALIAATRTTAFLKSSIAVYDYRTEHDSVTRGNDGGIRSPRFYDRLLTSRYALSDVGFASMDPNARAALTERFIQLFLFNSISLHPSNAATWLASVRVVREFRSALDELGIHPSSVRWAEAGSVKGTVLRSLFLVSHLIPNQHDFFCRLRHEAWGQHQIEIPDEPKGSLAPERDAGHDRRMKMWPPQVHAAREPAGRS